jgi:hypothetical protein
MRPKHILKYEQDMLDWYQGSGKWAGTPYDPSLLVMLAFIQYPDDLKLAAALGDCTRTWDHFGEYTYCTDPRTRQQVADTIFMDMPAGGGCMVDICVDGSIHGFEWMETGPKQVAVKVEDSGAPWGSPSTNTLTLVHWDQEGVSLMAAPFQKAGGSTR